MSREMKQSGVPWLKDIPSNWNVERGKNVLVLQKRPVRESDEVVTCFRDGEVILRSLRRTEGFTMSDKEIGYQGINEGDIVIHGMDGFAGAMGVSKSTGKGSPVLVVCSPKYDAIPQYIIYYLRALAMTDVFIALATGIRERSCDLRWNKISELEFILPSSIEQQKIASFLDRKCAEIDEMIALQEKIVEELKAYKQSVITEAVTKGLNPDVPMKDSGIEWIGEIPEHWEVLKSKKILLSNDGGVWGEEPDGIDDTVVLRSTEQDIDGKLIIIEPAKRKLSLKEREASLLKRGDLIITKSSGSPSHIGKTSIIDEGVENLGCCYSNFIQRIRVKGEPKYYWYIFNSLIVKKQFEYLSTTTTGINNINSKIIEALFLPCTSAEEQEGIALYLDTKCTEIDNLISIKLSKIDSLKEYKKSIIYEYVTGKKEVI